MAITYVVVVGQLEAPPNTRWVGVPRDPPDLHVMLQCDTLKDANAAQKLFKTVGLYAEVHRTFSGARIDQSFRNMGSEA